MQNLYTNLTLTVTHSCHRSNKLLRFRNVLSKKGGVNNNQKYVNQMLQVSRILPL